MKNIFVTVLLVFGMAAFAQEATDAFGPVENGQCRIVIFGRTGLVLKALYKIQLDSENEYEFIGNSSYLVIDAPAGRHSIGVAVPDAILKEESFDGISFYLDGGETLYLYYKISQTGLKCNFIGEESVQLQTENKTPVKVSSREGTK